eukprot:jgi/Mesvir1/11613/Mv00020-RA.1
MTGNVVHDDKVLLAQLLPVNKEWYDNLLDLAKNIWGEDSVLPGHVRIFTTIALDISNGTAMQPFPPHVEMILRRPGFTFSHIREFLNFCAFELGYNRVPGAFGMLADLEKGMKEKTDQWPASIFEAGSPEPMQEGEAVLADIKELLPKFYPGCDEAFVSNYLDQASRVYKQGMLVDAVTKLFTSLALDVQKGIAGQPFAMHVELLLRRGLTFDAIRTYLNFLTCYMGFNRVPAAFGTLAGIEAEKKA